MESLIFDTTFLIDFQRERTKQHAGKAHRFLQNNSNAVIYLPSIVVGEYAEGFEETDDTAFVSVIESFELLPLNRDVAIRYGRLTRSLRKSGNLIATNDLWIAATALAKDLPLVTRNTEHFSRIENLKLISY